MAPPILGMNRSLLNVRETVVYTRVRLLAHTLTGKFVAAFDDLLTEWQKVFEKELALLDARIAAGALIDEVDTALDLLVDRFSALLLTRTAQDRGHDLYRFYFKTGRPSDVKRPLLGDELVVLKAWLPSLTTSTDAELKALGQELDKLWLAGDKAEKAWADADERIAAFRTLGERKAFLDKVNRVRQGTYGDLQQLRLGPQGTGLATDFASSFFQRRSEPEPTLDSLRLEIAQKEKEIAELRAKLQLLEATTSLVTEARRHSERLEKEAALREQEEQLKAMQERIAALKGELGQ